MFPVPMFPHSSNVHLLSRPRATPRPSHGPAAVSPTVRRPRGSMVCSGHPTGETNKKKSWQMLTVVLNHLGVSENSVSLNPMVNDHYPY